MLPLIKPSQAGFTLVELLVAIGIIGIISIIGVQSLYDIVSVRSAQQSIEADADALRLLLRTMSKSVMGAQTLTINSPQELRVVGQDSCETYHYDSTAQVIVHAQELTYPCAPPTAGFNPLTASELAITGFTLSPLGVNVPVVTIEVEGKSRNSLTSHVIKFNTTATPRK